MTSKHKPGSYKYPTTAAFRRRRLVPMRDKYDDRIHDESGHIIHDTKMAIRHHRRYLPYVLGFLCCWFVYHFLTRPRPPPQYSCHFVTKTIHNYTWTYPDCPPVSSGFRVDGIPAPVWTEECFQKELSEEVYGRPKAPADHQAEVTPDSNIKVPGLRNACPPFPMEAFPKETPEESHRKHHHSQRPTPGATEGSKTAQNGSDHHEHLPGSDPKFSRLAPEGWLYGVLAVYDTRVGPFPHLRIFGLSRIVPGEIYCQFSCKEHAHAVVTSPAKAVPLKIDDTVDDSCFWQQYVFTCEVREKCTPGYASLSKAPCGPVSGIIPVMPAQHPPTPPPHQFALCLSTIYDKTDSDAGYLAEFLEASRHFGVEKVFLYGTYNVSKRYNAVLDVYKSQGLVEYLDWDIPNEVSVVYKFAQLLQYSHCMYLNMREAQFLALVELEDLLFPSHNPNFKGLFEQIQANERMDNLAYLTVERRSMCSADIEGRVGNVGEMLEDGRKLLELRLVNQHAMGEFQKQPTYIVNPGGVLVPYIYQDKVISMKGWRSSKVSTAMALTYHYGSEDSGCLKVDSRSRNDITLCKDIPEISKKVLYALHMFDLINTGNRHPKKKDLLCT